MTEREVREMFQHIHGEMLLQSLALKALFRAAPEARNELAAYLQHLKTEGLNDLDDIARESFLDAAASLLVGRK